MNVVFLDTVHAILQERLTEAGFNCINAEAESYDRCKELVTNADGIVIRSRFKMDASFLKDASNLKFIARSGAGMENIDVHFCEENNIQLFNAPEGNRNAVGEHALGMLLTLLNRIHVADNEVRNGKWDREGNRGIELEGKTVGIIGFGNNGSAFAKKLAGFDVRILAHDKYKSNFGNDDIQEVELKELLDKSDVISFHIPQNEETVYYANDDFFNSLSKSIYIINLSRGKIIKTSALVNAIKSGKVAGACLDVLEYEKSSFETFFDQNLPEEFEYLLNSNKLLFTPHVGGWTVESYYKLSDVLADKIIDYSKLGRNL